MSGGCKCIHLLISQFYFGMNAMVCVMTQLLPRRTITTDGLVLFTCEKQPEEKCNMFCGSHRKKRCEVLVANVKV